MHRHIYNEYFQENINNINQEEYINFIQSMFIDYIPSFMLIVFLFGIYIYYYGSTPGKIILGIKQVNYKYQKLGFFHIFIRLISYAFSALPFCIGFIMIDYNKKSRGLHDYIANTYVIRVPDDELVSIKQRLIDCIIPNNKNYNIDHIT